MKLNRIHSISTALSGEVGKLTTAVNGLFGLYANHEPAELEAALKESGYTMQDFETMQRDKLLKQADTCGALLQEVINAITKTYGGNAAEGKPVETDSTKGPSVKEIVTKLTEGYTPEQIRKMRSNLSKAAGRSET